MVDTRDLKSLGASCTGSSPVPGTTISPISPISPVSPEYHPITGERPVGISPADSSEYLLILVGVSAWEYLSICLE